MKLLFYISSMRGGGAERVLSIVCNKLSERGHEIYVATNLEHEVVYKLNPAIKIVDLHIKRGKSRIKNYWLLVKRIRKVAKNVKPDIIISFVWPLTAKVIPATLGLKIPLISSEHSTFDTKRTFYESLVRLHLNKLADNVTILTQHDYRYLNKRLPRKIVVPNPLTYKIYEKDLSPRRKNLLAIGSIDRWHVKGFDNLIKIWSEIAPNYSDWTLEIAGGGNEVNMSILKNITKEYNVAESVKFLGFQREIDKIMRQSSIFVLSSREEGFGMVLTEAMSQGCACVSFDCKSGPGEIIVNDRCGVLIPDQDMQEMKSALIKLIENEDIRKTVSIGCRDECLKFAPDIIADKWEKIFERLK